MESREGYQRPNKRPFEEIDVEEEKVYRFKVLLPNGTSIGVTFRDPKPELPLEEFIFAVKSEYMRSRRVTESPKRVIKWSSENIYLEDALLSSSGSEHTWKTDGGIMIPFKDDVQKSPQGSFTKVEISGLKMKILEVFQLGCKLKDIYFPYIQCDEASSTGRTITPIEFEVNGVNLAEVEGGEVATTNLLSCNGPEFVLQLHFYSPENAATKSQGSKAHKEANARLKCVYFPIVEVRKTLRGFWKS